jgi:hypothetical protein
VLSGQQTDWDVQEKVALIPDEVWEAGPEAVAAEIARIEEQLRLRREVAGLKAQLANARAGVAALSKRSHNNPPELVEPMTDVERQANSVAQALNEAERELAQYTPRPAVLRRVGQVLMEVATRSLSYCASLGDTALRKAAEEVGSAGGKALVGAALFAWMSHLEAVQTLARALEAFAKLISGR